MADPRRRRDERGTALLMIIGFAMVLLMTAAVVTDASAAYLQRQGLDTVADGAALTAADAGASGDEAYAAGLDADLHLDLDVARAAVFGYLRRLPGAGETAGVVGGQRVRPSRRSRGCRDPEGAPLHLEDRHHDPQDGQEEQDPEPRQLDQSAAALVATSHQGCSSIA